MPNGKIVETLPSEEELEIQIQEAGAGAGVSPFDPDFLLFALPFAFLSDVLDIILELTGIFIIPKIVGILLDIFTFVVLIFPGWMYWRLKRIGESKKARQVTLERTVQKARDRLTKLQKLGKVSLQAFERYMQRYGQQLGRIGRATARAARIPLTRTLIRGVLILLGEIIWLIGLLPFWIIGVILTLREK